MFRGDIGIRHGETVTRYGETAIREAETARGHNKRYTRDQTHHTTKGESATRQDRRNAQNKRYTESRDRTRPRSRRYITRENPCTTKRDCHAAITTSFQNEPLHGKYRPSHRKARLLRRPFHGKHKPIHGNANRTRQGKTVTRQCEIVTSRNRHI